MTRPHPLRPRPLQRPRRLLSALGLAAAVLLLHAWVLGRLPSGAGTAWRADVPSVLQVRQVRAMTVAQAEAAAEQAPAALPVAPARPAATLREAVAHLPPGSRTVQDMQADVPLVDGAGAQPSSTSGVAGGAPTPRYATRLPPPATLQYSLQREGTGGPGRSGLQAELRWRPAEGTYTLTLGFGAVGWASVGGLDADGVAPERHVETRRGREVRAANFRREAGPTGGRITFSGPQVEFALLPGAQDRLSWMLQLPAVLEADPMLGQPGREVRLFVAGVRGDAGLWTFTVVDRGPAELPAGTVAEAVHLRREPQRPYDSRVDVWLDPARHHLPVRVRLDHLGDGGGTDFLLSGISLP